MNNSDDLTALKAKAGEAVGIYTFAEILVSDFTESVKCFRHYAFSFSPLFFLGSRKGLATGDHGALSFNDFIILLSLAFSLLSTSNVWLDG